jgi:hypothetical protein
MSLCIVPIEHLPFIWPQARGYVVKALDRDGRGCYLPEDVLKALLDGICRLWISWHDERERVEAVVVTETIQYPRRVGLRLWLIGGENMKAWGIPMRDLLEEYAIAHGCDAIEGGLRKGWLRIGGEGWHETGITFEKRLDKRATYRIAA